MAARDLENDVLRLVADLDKPCFRFAEAAPGTEAETAGATGKAQKVKTGAETMATATAPLFERYRPRTWGEVIAQPRTMQRLAVMATRGGFAGRAYWISGESGTGKTTIARLLAAEVADDYATWELDASTLTPKACQDIEKDWAGGTFGKGGRAYLVNEAHGLRKDTIRQLLVMLERIPRHVVVVFTTTNSGQDGLFEDVADAGPLTSRCICFSLAKHAIARPFAERCKAIAELEGLGGAPLAAYTDYGQACGWNMRAMLQAVESGEFIDDASLVALTAGAMQKTA